MNKRVNCTALRLEYSDPELDAIVKGYCMEHEEFRYSQICEFILELAQKENKLVMDQQIFFGEITLAPQALRRISRTLWKLLWRRRLFIDFQPSEEIADPHDFQFVRFE